MNWKKKTASLLLVICLVIGMLPAMAAETETNHQQASGMPFTDVKPGAWFYDAVEFVYENELMKGTSETKFEPNGTLTRAMVVQILYCKEDKPECNGSVAFSDVAENQWFYNAVQWAVENEITAGMGNGKFNPNSKVTREQFAQFMYRYHGLPEVSGTLDFPDANKASGWAVNALLWATQNGLINGSTQADGSVLLMPKSNATRAQAAVIVQSLCELEMLEEIVAFGECGEDLVWMLYSDGLLVITGTGEMYDYSDTSEHTRVPWDSWLDIKEVYIDDGVTSIAEKAFYNCSNLTDVTIPDTVTSIGQRAFYRCFRLTGAVIPHGVTSIEDYTFYGCSALQSVTIPDSVTSIGDSAFYDCSNLTDVTIPSSVTSIANRAFYGCSALTSLMIPNSITSIGDSAFAWCMSLTSVTIPASVTSIGDAAFESCIYLTDVYYTGTDSQWSAITIGSNNTNLTNATIHYNS